MFGAYKLPVKPDTAYHNLFEREVKKIKINDMLVIIADYGHTYCHMKKSKNILTRQNISVNCQINSSSIGSHNISKYESRYFDNK